MSDERIVAAFEKWWESDLSPRWWKQAASTADEYDKLHRSHFVTWLAAAANTEQLVAEARLDELKRFATPPNLASFVDYRVERIAELEKAAKHG